MVCPKCRKSYRFGVIICVDCGCTLVRNPDRLTDREESNLRLEMAQETQGVSLREPVVLHSSSRLGPVGSIIELIVSVIVFVLSWQKLDEYKTGIGQFAVAVSKQAADEKLFYQVLVGASIAVAIISLVLIINYYSSRGDESTEPRIMLVCPGCKARVPDGQIFCGSCGERLTPSNSSLDSTRDKSG